MTLDRHPQQSELYEFARGALDDIRFEEVALHVEQCDECAARLDPGNVRVQLDETSSPIQELTEKTGTEIGPYKLLQLLGQGGMGVVYMAEQQHPVRRKVAIKIIKPGMDSQHVIARFEAERQALALMDHHNIARVLDAGTTDNGRPYFVMELVKGVPITEYCDNNRLTPRERLELIIPVCHAVQHAHQKGIIHRDIKPSNVLVALYDGKPVPKVIDFGIAKAINQRLTERTMFTQLGQVLGTLEYMSPEQAEMNQLDVDTRSDVYSLGVLVYELLTGTPPITGKQLRDAGYEEMMRTIREVEPPKPSTRISESGRSLPTMSVVRKTEPAKLSRMVRGDLDWIVMKALEKDRNRRYETANGLAADLLRYLADEPVTASPPSAAYRFRKFARRNKGLLTTLSATAGGLLVAAAVSTGLAIWALNAQDLAENRLQQMVRERDAKEGARRNALLAQQESEESARLAHREAVRSEQVASFLKEMLAGVGPAVALGRDTRLLEDVLKETVQRLDGALQEQPEVKADLWRTIGKVYRDLGKYENAKQLFERAISLREDSHKFNNAETADLIDDIGMTHMYLGIYDQAEGLFRRSMEIRKALPADQVGHASTLRYLAIACWLQLRYDEAESLHRQSLAIQQRLSPNDPDLAQNLNGIACVLMDRGQYREAEQLFREAVRTMRESLTQKHPYTAAGIHNLGRVLHARGKYLEAEKHYEESLSLREEVYEPAHPAIANSLSALAILRTDQGRHHEAEELHRKALKIHQSVFGNKHPKVARCLSNLGSSMSDQGLYRKAEKLQREAVHIMEGIRGRDHPDTAEILNNLSLTLAAQQKSEEAESLQREVLAVMERVHGKEHPNVAGSLQNLAVIIEAAGSYREAETLLERSLEILKARFGSEHPNVATVLHNLARVRARTAGADAEDLYQEAIRLRRQSLHPSHPLVAESLVGLATVQDKRGSYVDAEATFREAMNIYDRLSLFREKKVEVLEGLAGVLRKQKKFVEAEKYYRKALRLLRSIGGDNHPRVLQMMETLAAILTDLNRLEDAEQLFAKSLQLRKHRGGPGIGIATLNVGNTLFLQGKYAVAEGRFSEALQQLRESCQASEDPGVEICRLRLAQTLSLLGKFQGAERTLADLFDWAKEKLGEEHPRTSAYATYLVRTLLIRGDYGGAFMHQPFLAIHGQGDTGLLAMLSLLWSEQTTAYTVACEYALNMEDATPDRALNAAIAVLLNPYCDVPTADRAKQLLETCVSPNPNHTNAYRVQLCRGLIHLRNGRFTEAEEAFASVSSAANDMQSAALAFRAMAARQRSHDEEAQRLFQKAMQCASPLGYCTIVCPLNLRATQLVNLMAIQEASGSVDKPVTNGSPQSPEDLAIQAKLQWLQLHRDDGAALLDLCRLALWSGRSDDLHRSCLRLWSMEEGQRNPETRIAAAKAWLCLPTNDDQLLETVLTALSDARYDRNAEVVTIRGMSEYRAGRFHRALESLEEASRCRDRLIRALALFYRSMAFLQIGEAEKAREALRLASEISGSIPNREQATEMILNDGLYCYVAYNEARQLLEPVPVGSR